MPEPETKANETPPAETPSAKPTTTEEASPTPSETPEAAPSLIGKDEEKKETAVQLDPIVYTDFTLPEGVTLDPEGLKEFTDIVGPAQVPQNVAQRIVDMYVKNLQAVQADTQKGMTDAWVATRNEWTAEVKADKEIGGANLPKVTATIAKALDQFGASGVREALTLTGADNNPAIIKTLYKMASALAEGTHVGGGPLRVDPATLTPGQRLYGPDGPKTGFQLPSKET